MSADADHWEEVYRERGPLDVSWHQADPSRSLRLVTAAAPRTDAPIIDVGGGASRLVDRLLDLGYTRLTVLDIAATALSHARERLGGEADRVRWLVADVRHHRVPPGYQVWHDRAVFHFLVRAEDRALYVSRAREAVLPGGHLVIAAFGHDGPTMCSGLPIVRYGPDTMTDVVAPWFVPVAFEEEMHVTPRGAEQHFLYGVFARGF